MHDTGCGTIYVHLNLPETKGISLAAIQGLLQEQGTHGRKPAGEYRLFEVPENIDQSIDGSALACLHCADNLLGVLSQ